MGKMTKSSERQKGKKGLCDYSAKDKECETEMQCEKRKCDATRKRERNW
jgi:hypothetical protein